MLFASRLRTPAEAAGPPPAQTLRGLVELHDVTVGYGTQLALAELRLAVRPGEFLCLLGPSGCGKSTAFNVIASFVRPTAGEAQVDGAIVRGPGPEAQSCSG
ncbi:MULTISPECIES: ATP-binding cassette domain-containing protein [Methylosinus]|nr:MULTISPECIES: ATP-binding cassette domain-containing protein [Methylosinus]